MDEHYKRHTSLDADSLTYSEQMVLDAVKKRKVPVNDVSEIAKVCRLSEMQASVAVQLLTHKKLIPPQ
ncbi:hypothetical protein E5161_02455 [Cohnella pontilimi]|uniref:MarR family transcriptional regulator n=1 Tax=Cohnella pontilimi TaxID=2564100 RepID=A0A4V5LSU2_9BACL|nr:hypothetical protein [Cohnella pontilimi]TJY44269.1 hypothetical protein E5161_02455 [Cohnella pontilimi]